MRKRSERLVVIAALAAMIALVFAVPVHHAHMLQAALAGPVEAVSQVAQHDHSGHGAHHHAEHHASAPSAQHSAPRGEHSGHDKPRCPVCSMAQAIAAPVPPWGPAIFFTGRRASAPLIVASATIPSSFHFLPVQPRAPPIAG